MSHSPSELGSQERMTVVGYPVTHSLSPAIHNAAFRELGLENFGVQALYLEPQNLPAEEAGKLVDGLRSGELRQIAVTMPHKETVIHMVDEVSDVAREIGAANTVTRLQNGTLRADNTDWIGARDALLEAAPDWTGKRALILGAGGAARGVIYALQQLGMEVCITNRTREKAEKLMGEFGIAWGESGEQYDLVFNATPVGMEQEARPNNVDATPLSREFLHPGMTVFDSVYKPLRTRLLGEAEANGCVTIDGLRMLVFQAIEQIRIWTAEVNPEVSQKVVENKAHLAEVMRKVAEGRLTYKNS